MTSDDYMKIFDAMLSYEIELKRWRDLVQVADIAPKKGYESAFIAIMSQLAYARGASDSIMHHEKR